jgi:CBS domain-containing protein
MAFSSSDRALTAQIPRDEGSKIVKVSDAMTKNVITTTPETAIEEAARLMIRHRVSGLPVIDGGIVVGVITEGDLLRRIETGTDLARSVWFAFLIAPGRLAQDYVRSHARKVGEVMTRDIVSVTADSSLAEVVALMEARRIKRLLVLEQGRLVGIISRADLLRALEQLLPKASVAALSDAQIRRRVLAEIDKQHWVPRACIDAKVENGVVELRGIVTDGRERDALRVIVENTPGVSAMRDHLLWVEPISGAVVERPTDDR